jgi:putative ABC transport system substrate-binding protein
VARRQLGHVEGQNLVNERFSGEGRIDDYPKIARDVATPTLGPCFCNQCGRCSQGGNVVAMTSDPVGHGIAASIARPGGNITVATVDAGRELRAKRHQLFWELDPTISKLGILTVRTNPVAGCAAI